MTERPYQICTRCIMDTSDPEITFDDQGVCNHCHEYDEKVRKGVYKGKEAEAKLQAIVEKIKADSKGKEYDCIAGLSGGVDSTYVCLKLKELGLRTLVVHFDNGWNSELAVKNVENTVKKLGFDLYTYVVNWNEFRDLQVSYLKASVLDLEATSDHGIFAALFKVANDKGIKYIISGSNIETEGILPQAWRYANKMDLMNLKAIHDKYGKVKLKTFPTTGIFKFMYFTRIKGIHIVDILNYLPFNKAAAKKEITEKLEWRDYGGKHHESIITRFYQSYILPRKFHIDKRRAHLSTLVAAGQISREEALKEMEEDHYDAQLLKEDLEYVPKKLGLTPEEFQTIMQTPPRSHYEFPNEKKYLDFFIKMKNKFFPKKDPVLH